MIVSLLEISAVALLGIAGWLWYESLGRRESAIDAARRACNAENVQLLDYTVALASMRPQRRPDGRLVLRRVYRFEFSDTGNNRLHGSVTLLGAMVETLYLEPHQGVGPARALLH